MPPSPPAFLRELTEHIPDPRAARGIRHRFTPILTAAITAILAGVRSLLKLFTLAGAVVTIDAMHILAETAQQSHPCEPIAG